MKMTENSLKRKGFPDWLVNSVYLSQDGICGNQSCNNPLSNGFHRHHNNNDRSDNKRENCQLLCLECHFATFAEGHRLYNAYNNHKNLQLKIMDAIMKVLADAEGKKVAGSKLDKMLDGYDRAVKLSWNANIRDQVERPNPIFAAYTNMMKNNIVQDALMEGYRLGIQAVTVEIKGE